MANLYAARTGDANFRRGLRRDCSLVVTPACASLLTTPKVSVSQGTELNVNRP